MARFREPVTSKRRLAAAERQRQALELKKAGADYRTIAERVGYAGPAGAYKAVTTALKALVQEPAEELRTMEVARLDQMLLGLWPKAIKGDTWAVDRVLKIMERRAALLGLDAPVKRELSGSVELRTYAERVAGDLGLEPAEVLAQAERIIAEAGA
jgi:hypothetical protein